VIGPRTRLVTVLSIALCAAVAPLSAVAELPGYTAHFYGWHPDSHEFSYSMAEHRRSKPVKRRYYMKSTRIKSGPKNVARGKTIRGSVPRRARELGYQINQLKEQRLSNFVQAFIVGPGLTLRIVLELRGDTLGYTAFLDDAMKPGDAERLIGGHFKEVWTEFEADVYLSPDKKWVAVFLRMKTPYKQQSWVEGLRVGGRR
jgi:hypothetical protein